MRMHRSSMLLGLAAVAALMGPSAPAPVRRRSAYVKPKRVIKRADRTKKRHLLKGIRP